MSVIHPKKNATLLALAGKARMVSPEGRAKQLAALRLHQFQPGIVNYPDKQPSKTPRFTETANVLLNLPYWPDDPESPTYMEVLATMVVLKAIEGDRGCLVVLLDRVDPTLGRERADAAAKIIVNMIAETAHVSLPSATTMSPIIDSPALPVEDAQKALPIGKNDD